MSAPEITFELDPGPWGTDPEWRDFRATGGSISGRATVTTDELIKCRGVDLVLGWRTEGRGDRDQQLILEDRVHAGELYPGTRVFPFQATLPEGPISYDGHHIKIVWFVGIQIDIAWKRDPKNEMPFFVTLP